MSSSTILVIEADEPQRQELKAILQFLDYGMVDIGDCANWRQSVEDPNALFAVLMGRCQSEAEVVKVFQDLKAQVVHGRLMIVELCEHLWSDDRFRFHHLIVFPHRQRVIQGREAQPQ